MLSTTKPEGNGSGLHVAIIMDGNGRWSRSRGLSRQEGHKAGAAAVRRAVELAAAMKIDWLTLFAFSSDNWHRPSGEVTALLDLFAAYLRDETAACVEHGIRLSVLGRRDRLGSDLRREVERAERETRTGDGLRLRLAIDYSGREAILRAAHRCQELGTVSGEMFARLLASHEPVDGETVPDVDLLIRTGGEKRLSDFLLWESAWAELVFLDTMWPDFGAAEFEEALREFRGRDRRFGRVSVSTDMVGGRPGSAAR